MYRLLLVSDKEEVRELYERFQEWESLGFERPAIASSAEGGKLLLEKRKYDAISSLLSVKESKVFFSYLTRRPEMFGVEAARDEERLRREIRCARRTLSARDASRQNKQLDEVTHVMQHEFFYDLLRGTPCDKTKMDERMKSLKVAFVHTERPVTTVSFRIPQGDFFLSEVWRYGRDRLENALRNIFERLDENVDSDEPMYYLLLVINPHHMRLLGIPKKDMTESEVYSLTVEHMERCQKSLMDYFELGLVVKRFARYHSLYELGEENALRLTH